MIIVMHLLLILMLNLQNAIQKQDFQQVSFNFLFNFIIKK